MSNVLPQIFQVNLFPLAEWFFPVFHSSKHSYFFPYVLHLLRQAIGDFNSQKGFSTMRRRPFHNLQSFSLPTHHTPFYTCLVPNIRS